MRAVFRNREKVQAISGVVAQAFDDLVTAINSRPLEIGDVRVFSGTGTPEGKQIGNIGDLWLRTDGLPGFVHYHKSSGTNTKTGWVPLGTSRGSWTAVDGSGAGLTFGADAAEIYSAVSLSTGRQVTVSAGLVFPATASAAPVVISGLPFVCGSTPGAGALAYTSSGVAFSIYVREGTSQIELFTLAGASVTNVQMTGAFLRFTATYITAI